MCYKSSNPNLDCLDNLIGLLFVLLFCDITWQADCTSDHDSYRLFSYDQPALRIHEAHLLYLLMYTMSCVIASNSQIKCSTWGGTYSTYSQV